ncbi:MAG: hypothetical protein CVU87_08110 [Firmicutes bacterium HGW-Firmicutes-12]|nr:MAG: hypothetical protein CVU87_08110 [Firmicutes bacterium HGW-Firmicutes-12]
MMMKNKQSKKNTRLADNILFSCVGGFIIMTAVVIFLGYSQWISFLQLLFASAMIGGIADWYGVTSIYGRPLGINWRTEIIIKQRAELTSGIKEFICEEILSKENICEKLPTLDIVG